MARIQAVHVHFSSRSELEQLDKAAKQLGGVRAATEFRPCYGFVNLVEKPHSATYLFTTEALVQEFTRQRPTE